MNYYINKSHKIYKKYGLVDLIVKIILFIFNKPDEIQKAQINVWKKLSNMYGSIVQYGPFKGMKIGKKKSWELEYGLTTKILGTYEEQILNILIKFSKKNNTFIDIGAADGFFVVGMAFKNIFKNIYAFEINSKSREVIKLNYKLNICKKNIKIKSEASYLSLKRIIKLRKKCTILIDIEGAEFDLLSLKVLELLKDCSIVCELHLFYGEKKYYELIKNAKKIFHCKLIKKKSYNPNKFKELNNFSDNERLLALSEGRKDNQEWMILTPK
jgi:hypothetical protein